MPFYGPWITPPEVTVTDTQNLLHFTGLPFTDTDFDTLCELSYDDGTVFDFHNNNALWTVDDLGQFHLEQVGVDLDVQGVDSSWSPPTPPPTAVDVQVDGDSTLIGLHVSLDVAETTSQPSPTQDVHLFLTTNAPADLIYDPAHGGRPGTHLIPGAAINPYATVSLPAGVTGVTIAADVPLAHISAPYPGTGIEALQVVVGAAEQASHTPPPFVTGHISGRAWKLVSQATLTFTFQPPNYRWVYDIPPAQRQFPRDDGLGISTRRSWPPPTSKQYGQRRGPAATYQ